MRILNQPPGGRASFAQFPIPPFTSASPAPLTSLDVTTPPKSTASRTVFVTSTDRHAQINVEIVELGGSVPLPDGLHGTVIINADIENPAHRGGRHRERGYRERRHREQGTHQRRYREPRGPDCGHRERRHRECRHRERGYRERRHRECRHRERGHRERRHRECRHRELVADRRDLERHEHRQHDGRVQRESLPQPGGAGRGEAAARAAQVLHDAGCGQLRAEAPIAHRAGRQHPEPGVRHAGFRWHPQSEQPGGHQRDDPAGARRGREDHAADPRSRPDEQRDDRQRQGRAGQHRPRVRARRHGFAAGHRAGDRHRPARVRASPNRRSSRRQLDDLLRPAAVRHGRRRDHGAGAGPGPRQVGRRAPRRDGDAVAHRRAGRRRHAGHRRPP